uniref:Ankyrin repeat domain 26 n=1 Tax=Zosterops lateralis melanops TaxID=1220523 RepID=A0A8D2P0X9_ZOSLA
MWVENEKRELKTNFKNITAELKQLFGENEAERTASLVKEIPEDGFGEELKSSHIISCPVTESSNKLESQGEFGDIKLRLGGKVSKMEIVFPSLGVHPDQNRLKTNVEDTWNTDEEAGINNVDNRKVSLAKGEKKKMPTMETEENDNGNSKNAEQGPAYSLRHSLKSSILGDISNILPKIRPVCTSDENAHSVTEMKLKKYSGFNDDVPKDSLINSNIGETETESLFGSAQELCDTLERNLDEELKRDMERFKIKVGMLQTVFLALEKEKVQLQKEVVPYSSVFLHISGPVHFSYSSLNEDALCKLVVCFSFSTILLKPRFTLKQEEEKRLRVETLYEKTREKLRRQEEQYCKEMEEKQQLELQSRNLEMELVTLRKLFKQESDTEREKDLLYKNQLLQDEIAMLRLELDQIRLRHQEEEGKYLEENETLKEKNEDLQKELKLNEEALTQTVFQYNGQLNLLKTESAMLTSKLEQTKESKDRLETEIESFRSRLNTTVQELERHQSSKSDVERTLQRERDEWLRLQDKLHHDLSDVREANKSLSQQLSKAESKANSLENELHQLRQTLREKALLLEMTQKELSQTQCQAKEYDHARQLEKDQVNKLTIKQESMQERLAQLQSENLLLRQQLEDLQNKGIIKEKVVNDVQDRFNDIFNKLRADTEKQIYLVEERNKELNAKCIDLREQLDMESKKGMQLEAQNRDLRDELSTLHGNCEKLEKSKCQLKEEVAKLQHRLETNMVDHSQIEQYKREVDERAGQEIRQKLQEVHCLLQAQAASQDRLEHIRASHHASLRNQLKERIRDLECELDKIKNTQQESTFPKECAQAEVEKYKELYQEEVKTRRCLAKKLESIVSGGLAATPVLYSTALGHLGNNLGLSRSLSLGGGFLSPTENTLSSRNRVAAFVAKVSILKYHSRLLKSSRIQGSPFLA